MHTVLVLGRNPADMSAAEMQAVACALRQRVEKLKFVRIDTQSPDDHRHVVLTHRAQPVTVLLDNRSQAPIVAAAVADKVPHFLFAQDHTNDGAQIGNRLFWLPPSGEFTLCRRQHGM